MLTSTTLTSLRHTSERHWSTFSAFVARLSFWQFAGFCLLLIVAAGLLDNLIRPWLQTNDNASPEQAIVTLKDAAEVIAKRQAADPQASKDDEPTVIVGTPPSRLDPTAAKPFSITIGGNDGITIKGYGSPAAYEDIIHEFGRSLKHTPSKPRHFEISLPDIVMLLIAIMLMIRLIARSRQRVAHAESAADHASLERQLAEAKLQALQAQVEPHFLFNTLAGVEHLIETDPPRAKTMQRHLIDFLRSLLPNLRQPLSTLGREIDMARHYLELMQFRLEERLTINIDLPPALSEIEMPPLMLQSLVENAIKHGIEPNPEGGQITITAERQGDALHLCVADTGAGIVEADRRGQTSQSGGLGLDNIRERLAARYGPTARLLLEANSPRGARATLILPCQPSQAR